MASGDKLHANLPYRPLGVVKKILDTMGIEISYAYEDLVFITHNHFLLQFGEVGADMSFYRNVEITSAEGSFQHGVLAKSFAEEGISLRDNGSYTMTAQDDDTVSVSFSPAE